MVDAPIEKRIAERVRSLRVKQGLSQGALARLAGTSRSQVAAVERGDRSPTVSTVEAFAHALGVSLADLLAAGSIEKVAIPDRATKLAVTLRERGPTYLSAVEKLVTAIDTITTEAKEPTRSTSRRRQRR